MITLTNSRDMIMVNEEIGYNETPNPDYRIFAIRKKITQKPFMSDLPIGIEDMPGYVKNFFDKINETDGIMSSNVNGNEIAIIKSSMFTWEEVMPTIQEFIEEMVSSKQLSEVCTN